MRIERDAFARMMPYWRALGFPFATLVPSYATAIGSSADRPAALRAHVSDLPDAAGYNYKEIANSAALIP